MNKKSLFLFVSISMLSCTRLSAEEKTNQFSPEKQGKIKRVVAFCKQNPFKAIVGATAALIVGYDLYNGCTFSLIKSIVAPAPNFYEESAKVKCLEIKNKVNECMALDFDKMSNYDLQNHILELKKIILIFLNNDKGWARPLCPEYHLSLVESFLSARDQYHLARSELHLRTFYAVHAIELNG